MSNPINRQAADTDNDFFFGIKGNTVYPALPVIIKTRQQAFRVAVWLKVLGDCLPDEPIDSTYEEVEEAITGT